MLSICKSYISVKHSNSEMLRRFRGGIVNKNLLQSFFPVKINSNADFVCLNQWGTEQDIIGGSFVILESHSVGYGIVYTIDLPPLIAFEKFAQLNFFLKVVYVVESVSYAGRWDNEGGDKIHNIDLDTYIAPEYRL